MKYRSDKDSDGPSNRAAAISCNRSWSSRRRSLYSTLQRASLLISIIVLFQASASAFHSTAPPDSSNRAEAERMWELMIEAKGGRERLHSVSNLLVSSYEKYLWGFRILTVNYRGLCVFPNKLWEWDDQRGTVFGFAVRLHNFEKDLHLSYADAGHGAHVRPIISPSMRGLILTQLELLNETTWVRPIPQSFRTEKVDGRTLDIIQTKVRELPGETKVEFVLDRKTHLPVKLTYYWVRNNREFSGDKKLSNYVDVDGIRIPSKFGRISAKYRINVEYDPQIFEQPPSREAGIDAWMKN